MKPNLLHIVSLITAVFEGLFFTGLIFGWSSISFVLKSENYFGNLCTDTEAENRTLSTSTSNDTSLTTIIFITTIPTPSIHADCKGKDENINLVFTIASVALSFSTLPIGFVFDKCGTWVSRVIAILFFTCGCILTSLSTIQTSVFLYPAMCCFSIGGILLLVTNMQLGNLFGPARSSVITLLNGALDSSSFVFLLVKLAYDSGIAFNAIFQFVAICTIFLWIRTILLMPKMHIPFPLPSGVFKFGLYDCKSSPKTDPSQIQLNDATAHGPNTADEDDLDAVQSFSSCVCSLKFWTNLLHLSLLQLRNYFFLGTFVSWMEELLPPDSNQLGGYINVFGVCQFFGVLTAPLNGLLIDGMKKWFVKHSNSAEVSSTKAIAVSALITSSLGVLFSVIVAIPIIDLQYVAFILQVLFRSFLYGGNASFIAFSFPGQHFGKLYGMTMTLAGIIALLQFPLFSLVLRILKKNFVPINIAFLVVCAVTYVHPALLYFRSGDGKKKLQKYPQELQKLSTEPL